MPSIPAVLIPAALLTATIGTVTGHALHTRIAAADKPVASVSVDRKAEAPASQATTAAAAWALDPALMDSSWRRWPSLTDF